MKNVLKLLIPIFILAATSCERIVTDVTPPVTKPKLVLFAFISPNDTLTEAIVSLSNPIYNNNGMPTIIAAAQVSISNNEGASANLIFNNGTGTYQIGKNTFSIEAGKTYTLQARFRDYFVTGNTTVPIVPGEISNIQIISNNNVSTSVLPALKIITTIKENGLNNQYYRTITNGKHKTLNNSFTEFCGNNLHTSKNSTTNTFKVVCDYYNSTEDVKETYDSIQVKLLTTDNAYYEYHLRRLNYFGSDPFSEPLQMFNNVSGGLGCVGSYLLTTKNIKIN